jgi:hypothetical protein
VPLTGFYRPLNERPRRSCFGGAGALNGTRRVLESNDEGRRRPGSFRSEDIIDKRPSIVGPTADRIIGFFAGIFIPVFAIFPTAVTMFLWSRTRDKDESYRRRRHALSVTFWCIVGSLVMVALVSTILVALIAAAEHNILPTPSLTPSS